MEINVLIDEDINIQFEVSRLREVAKHTLVAEKVKPETELSLVITSQEKIRQLNRDYLGRDRPTDVLAFSLLSETSAEDGEIAPPFIKPPDGVLHLGEVIISYPQAIIQAKEHHHSVEKEITILIIHGVLHLLGYDHGKSKAACRMSAREREIIDGIEVE